MTSFYKDNSEEAIKARVLQLGISEDDLLGGVAGQIESWQELNNENNIDSSKGLRGLNLKLFIKPPTKGEEADQLMKELHVEDDPPNGDIKFTETSRNKVRGELRRIEK